MTRHDTDPYEGYYSPREADFLADRAEDREQRARDSAADEAMDADARRCAAAAARRRQA